jgi:signal transduction histidine kinase
MDTRIIIVISGALFSIVVISFLFRFILLYQKRTNAFISERKVLEARYQQELLKAQLEMQEQTLKHISQEIHDNIGQTLSLAKLNLNRITDDVASGNVQQSTQLLTKAIADLRSLSRSLHADTVLSGGLIKAIATELNLLEKSGGYATALQTAGEAHNLSPQHELLLFRIVQEAFNNIIKHSQATRIEVKINFTPANFALHIEDDGKGLPSGTGRESSGIGLRSMQNRVDVMKGELTFQSAPGAGTRIQINIPA